MNQSQSAGDSRTDIFLGNMGAGSAAPARYAAAWQRGPETPASAAATAGAQRAGSTRAPMAELIPAGLGPDARPYGNTDFTPDGKRDLVQGDDAPVSARLRPAVAAYFEAIWRLDAERDRE